MGVLRIVLAMIVIVTALWLRLGNGLGGNLASIILNHFILGSRQSGWMRNADVWVVNRSLELASQGRNDSVSSQSHLTLGLFAEERGDHTAAITHWRSANSAPFWERLGNLALARGDLPEAALLLKRSIAIEPNQLSRYFALASSYLSDQQYVRQAAEVYGQISSIAAPSSFDSYFAQGRLFALQRDWPNALEQFGRAIMADPQRIEAHLQAAIAAENAGQYSIVVTHLKNALELSSKRDWTASWLYVGMGNAYRQMGQYSEASSSYAAAAKIQPSNPGIHQGHASLGQIYFDRSLFSEAARQFRVAAVLAPESKDYFYRMGLSYESCGQTSKAEKAFRRVLELDPANAEALDALKRLPRN